ncbi:MAG: sensor histidine kinase [Betaproteobacteria bacterium]|nr:sensor histidine kinase [Betaproteobacteria bacterium]
MTSSINQNGYRPTLPNFRNLGIMLRALVLANGMALAAALVKGDSFAAALAAFTEWSALLEPVLLLCLVSTYALNNRLAGLSYRAGIAAVVAIAVLAAVLVHAGTTRVVGVDQVAPLAKHLIVSVIVALVLLGYFHLRGRALSPALAEARLQALQARIRPHFLFNSLNAVLSLIRSEPKRAEQALEDLSELFRVLMADNRELAPLRQEVELCRQYLALEQLRMGERLQVEWHVDNLPGEALIPPLVLQPLLENAVYHGIEPTAEPGVISINIYKRGDEVHAVLRNPYREEGSHHAGNKMALANIRERLALHFDEEARLETEVRAGSYQVHITVPYVTARLKKGAAHP